MQGHVSHEQLTAWAEKSLPQEDRTPLEEHLQVCQECRNQAERIEEIRRRLSEDARELGPVALEGAVLARIERDRQRCTDPAAASIWCLRHLRNVFSGAGVRTTASVAVVLIVLVFFWVFLYTPSRAWTLERSIEAIQGKKGVYLAGSLVMEGVRVKCEMWIRGRDHEAGTRDLLLRTDHGRAIWVSGNATYFYNPADPVVYTDDAQTAGFSHWPGPAFLELVRKISRNVQIDYRLDVFRARRLAVLKAQIVDMGGTRSFVLEFDASSKLLVRMQNWNNSTWSGAPVFEADTVTYLDSIPDDLFRVELPSHVAYRERDVSVAPEMIGVLSSPAFGLSLPGLSMEEVSRKTVERVYTAEIAGDLAAFRRLVPVASLWGDEQLKTLLGGVDGREWVAEIVELRTARIRGHSALGPLTVVPAVVRQKDGRLYEHKLIVQVRQGAGADFSCVVYGPYGAAYPLD